MNISENSVPENWDLVRTITKSYHICMQRGSGISATAKARRTEQTDLKKRTHFFHLSKCFNLNDNTNWDSQMKVQLDRKKFFKNCPILASSSGSISSLIFCLLESVSNPNRSFFSFSLLLSLLPRSFVRQKLKSQTHAPHYKRCLWGGPVRRSQYCPWNTKPATVWSLKSNALLR